MTSHNESERGMNIKSLSHTCDLEYLDYTVALGLLLLFTYTIEYINGKCVKHNHKKVNVKCMKKITLDY